MPSSIAHGMVAVALGSAVAPRPLLRPMLIAGVVCAAIPDVDAVGRLWSAGDLDFLGGHRGFTHSLVFAGLLGVSCGLATRRRSKGMGLRVGIYIAAVTAAHGILDAFTAIGAATSPPQFFSPFSTEGYVAPWRPVEGPFSELLYVLLPLVVLTRWIFHVRGFQWPRRAPPTSLDLGSAKGRPGGARPR